MCVMWILAIIIVADYCAYYNRHQQSFMPETVFLLFKENSHTGSCIYKVKNQT